MENNLLQKAEYILYEMKFMISNPDEIVSSRHDMDKVLRSIGIDTVGKTIEEKYIELKNIVGLSTIRKIV